jgi:hypothetical protein
MLRHIFLAAIVCAAPLPALADDRADMEAFMAEYLKAWNAHDAAAITSTYYRLDTDHAWSTQAGMEAEFARLRALGYATSDIKSVTGCMVTADTGKVELRYTRLTTDGGFMPPRDRASIYQLRKFEDGWRITSFAGMPAEQKMECAG